MRAVSALLFLFATLLPGEARAEFSAMEPQVQEASKLTRPSGVRFERRGKASGQSTLAFRFALPLPHGAGTFDGKPACAAAKVRRRPVLFDSPQLTFFDMLIYDYRDANQVDSAAHWELPTVPYLEGALVNPYQVAPPQQYWARFFDIQCLPTRIHYRVVDGTKYEEYREGDRAFDRQY